jgi:hypothetical protein
LGWAFEYLHQCHHSKRPIIILKLDFEKDFDLIEHSVVIAMLRAKVFPDRWMKWVQYLFCSATSSVLLNGTAGKTFLAKGGFDKEILSVPSFLQLLLTFYKVFSTMNMLMEL